MFIVGVNYLIQPSFYFKYHILVIKIGIKNQSVFERGQIIGAQMTVYIALQAVEIGAVSKGMVSKMMTT